MVRTANITQEQVNRAAAQLRAEGRAPSTRAIRELLGTGSNATVQAMLNRWQAEQPAVALPAVPAVSEGLATALAAELTRIQAETAAAHGQAVKDAIAARNEAMTETGRQIMETARLEELLASQAKALHEAEGRAKALEQQVAELRGSEARRVEAEQRAAVAEAKLGLVEPRATLVDSLHARITELTTLITGKASQGREKANPTDPERLDPKPRRSPPSRGKRTG